MRSVVLSVGVLFVSVLLNQASVFAEQDQSARVQQFTGRLHAAETHAYLVKDLETGDRLTVSMRSTSGNLDPTVGIADPVVPLAEAMTRYREDLERLLEANESAALAVQEVRDQYFLAWDDDSGDGYAAMLEYVVPAPGDYVLIAAGSLSSLGRATSGEYELLAELNIPDTQVDADGPTGKPHRGAASSPLGARQCL